MAALIMEEALAVGDEVLEVPDPRAVDGGIVDLVQDAGGDGEPDRAARRVRRADRVLRALRPSRCDAGGTPKARFAARRIGMSYAPACRSMGPASGPAVPPAPRVQGGGSLAGKESMSTSSI